MHLPDFSTRRILVIGDLMLDRYWHGGTSRISPEAPVPVVRVDQIEERAGGAGNVALNIIALGGSVSLLGYRGKDEAGDRLEGLLHDAGIECHLRRLDGCPTITKLRVLSRHQQLIRLDFEQRFQPATDANLDAPYRQQLANSDVVVLSDYDKGTLSHTAGLIESARAAGIPVLVDPKGLHFDKYRGATLLTPNRSEFEAVVGPCPTEDDLVRRGQKLLAELSLEALLITRGEQGMSLLQQGQPPLHLPTHAKEVYDVTGAGDTVIATLASGLAAGLSMADATRLANQAAGLAVGKLGTATITNAELAAALQGAPTRQRGVIDLPHLVPLIRASQAHGERIVATNGCFDILHGVFNGSAKDFVDWVVPFEEDTPRALIGTLLPDILVKGGDYTEISAIAGHDHVLANGGEVRILPFVDGHSTTGLIERIHRRGQGDETISIPPSSH